jgi:hypothetical protein
LIYEVFVFISSYEGPSELPTLHVMEEMVAKPREFIEYEVSGRFHSTKPLPANSFAIRVSVIEYQTFLNPSIL